MVMRKKTGETQNVDLSEKGPFLLCIPGRVTGPSVVVKAGGGEESQVFDIRHPRECVLCTTWEGDRHSAVGRFDGRFGVASFVAPRRPRMGLKHTHHQAHMQYI